MSDVRAEPDRVNIEIWADLVCPWCYLGHARFRKALAGFGHRDQVRVSYRAFELDPGANSDENVTVREMLIRKYGLSTAGADAAEQRIADLAAAEGLPFSANRKHGNTFDAHRAVRLAGDQGLDEAVIEALYLAHFSGEGSIFDADAIAATAAGAGLDADQARKVLTGSDFSEEVRADERRADELGITGVPCFVANGRLAVNGAQPAEVLAELLEAAWEDSGHPA